jgi:flagellar FliL protein
MAKKPEKAKPEKTKPENPPAAESGVPEAKKGSGGLIGLLMLGAASLASSFGLFYFLTPAPVNAAAACAAAETTPEPVAPLASAGQTYVPVKEILITVGRAPATRYLKMNVSIATDSSGAQAVKDAEPVLIDAFNTYLRTIELEDFENPAFYSNMREQLARRSELVLGNTVSKGVLITEFLLR